MLGGLKSPESPRRPPPGVYCLDVGGCIEAECAGALADADVVAPDAIELLRIALGGPMSFHFSVDEKVEDTPNFSFTTHHCNTFGQFLQLSLSD